MLMRGVLFLYEFKINKKLFRLNHVLFNICYF